MFQTKRQKIIVSLILIGSILLIKWQLFTGNSEKFLFLNDSSVPSAVDLSSTNDSFPYSMKLIVYKNKQSSANNALLHGQIIANQQQILSPPTGHELDGVMETYSRDKLSEMAPPFKRILFWKENEVNKHYGIGNGRDALRQSGCPVWQCETSEDRSSVDEYDALVFHMRSWKVNDLPRRRSPHQRYVFWCMEAEVWIEYNVDPMANFFNWTMTHRWDSDIVSPYGFISPTGNVPLHPSDEQLQFYLYHHSQSNSINYAQGKMKMAAWVVSNCVTVRSSRNELIKELRKYIDVDVYGGCGDLKCPKKSGEYISSEECRDMVASKYKFYFALENSLCRYYVTEKFFDNMRRPILPVVFGLHQDHEMIAPPHSFINAAKFKNMKELADYMMLLDRNDTMYNEYFWWKPHFQVRDSQKDKTLAMCRLCAALHQKSLPNKIYRDMTDWWYRQSSCIVSPRIS